MVGILLAGAIYFLLGPLGGNASVKISNMLWFMEPGPHRPNMEEWRSSAGG